MEDLNGLEEAIRRIAREEITRALGAVGAVADGAMGATGGPVDIARGVLASVMERVARDVLADTHPALSTEHAPNETCTTCRHTEHTGGQCGNGLCTCVTFPSTDSVHTITVVPERARATCTCHRHTHVMGHDDRCGAPFCYCLSPVRARTEHADEHASTEAPRTCPTCKHGVHEAGKCSMHVYLRGVASPCPCLEWVRPEAVVSTDRPMCTGCEHAPHIGMYCPRCQCKDGLR